MSKAAVLKIATRGSKLALWQAEWVKAQLALFGHRCELVLIETQGDREHIPFARMQGQGFFTKAVQDAVLAEEADFAVHSLKDLPSARCPGLDLTAIPNRTDPRDVLIVQPYALDPTHPTLPLTQGAVVGTSAARRQAQLQHLRPDLNIQQLRGNVPTRLQKLQDRQYDAIMLAAAGLKRLKIDLSSFHVEELQPERFVPAPGQGALAIESRSNDPHTRSILEQIHDPEAAATIELERELMRRFDGGCQLALGAHARIHKDQAPPIELLAWYENKLLSVTADTPEEAAELAYQSLTQ